MEKSNSQKELQETLFILFCHLCLLGCLSRSLDRLTAKIAAILPPAAFCPAVSSQLDLSWSWWNQWRWCFTRSEPRFEGSYSLRKSCLLAGWQRPAQALPWSPLPSQQPDDPQTTGTLLTCSWAQIKLTDSGSWADKWLLSWAIQFWGGLLHSNRWLINWLLSQYLWWENLGSISPGSQRIVFSTMSLCQREMLSCDGHPGFPRPHRALHRPSTVAGEEPQIITWSTSISSVDLEIVNYFKLQNTWTQSHYSLRIATVSLWRAFF